MGPLRSATDKADAELAQVRASVAHWEAEADARRGQLSVLERSVGEQVLADVAAGGRLAEDMARLRAAVDIADRAAAAARSKVASAERAVLLARAGTLRTRVTKMRQDAARHWQRTDELLGQLLEHEGAEFVPATLHPDDVSARVRQGEVVVHPPVPRGFLLAEQADELERQAAALEAEAEAHVPVVAAPRAQLYTRAVPDAVGVLFYRPKPDMLEVFANMHVTDGQGGPFTFELVVDGRVVESVLLAANQGRTVSEPLGSVAAPVVSEVAVRVDGRVIERLHVDAGPGAGQSAAIKAARAG